MATVTFVGGTAVTNNQTTYASASFTPAAGDLIVLFVEASGFAGTPSLTDSSGDTYTLISTALKGTSADGLYFFVGNQLAAASARTITLNVSPAASGGGLQIHRVAGMTLTGSSAVRQSAVQQNQAAATPAPVLGVAALTGNPLFGAIFNATNAATMTAPTGWTENYDNGWALPATGIESVSIASGFTGTTVTWGSASASAFSSMVVELDTSAPSNQSFAPDVGALTLTGPVPTFTQTANQSFTPAVGALTLTGYAPTLAQTANQSFSPGVGALTLTGFAPTFGQTNGATFSPAAGTLTITGIAPSFTQSANQSFAPGVGALTLTGFAPAFTQSANRTFSPSTGALALAGYAPTFAQSDLKSFSPGVGALTLTGYAPTFVTASASQEFSPATGALALVGYAPLFTIDSPSSGGGGPDADESEAHGLKAGAAGRRLYAKETPGAPPAAGKVATEGQVATSPIAAPKPALASESLASVTTVELDEDDDEEAILMLLTHL